MRRLFVAAATLLALLPVVGVLLGVGGGVATASAAPQHAFVTNEGSNSVTPIDLETNKAEEEIKVGLGPYDIAVAPNGSHAYVTNASSNSVTPIDLETDSAGAEIKVGSVPNGIAITPNGKFAYVTNVHSDSVTPINLESDTAEAEIKVGEFPDGIAITPNGKYAFVTNVVSGSVTPINLESNTAEAEIKVGEYPVGIAIAPNGKHAYVVNELSDSVTPIELEPNNVEPEIKLTHVLPGGIAIAPDGKYAYVTEEEHPLSGNGSVVPIDLETNKAGAKIAVGKFPTGIAIEPHSTYAYVTNNHSGSVTPINTETNKAGGEIHVGSAPRGIAIAAIPPSPEPPPLLTIEPQETSTALFVAAGISRLSKVRNGTEELVLMKALEQLYRDALAEGKALSVEQAIKEINDLKALLGSPAAPTQASLELMTGNQRIIAILAMLENSELPSAVRLAVTHLAALALDSSEDIFANAEIPKYFEPLVDERSNLIYSSFAPATVLREAREVQSDEYAAHKSQQFGMAWDKLWQAAYKESVLSEWKALFAESEEVLDSSAFKRLRGEIEAGEGKLRVEAWQLSADFEEGQKAEQETTCVPGGSELGGKTIAGVPAPRCSGGAIYENDHFIVKECEKEPKNEAEEKKCDKEVENEGEKVKHATESRAGVIAVQDAIMTAAGELLRPSNEKAAALDQATTEAENSIKNAENEWLEYEVKQKEQKEIENIIKIGITAGSAVASFESGDAGISGGISGLFNTGLEIYSLVEEQTTKAPPGPQEIALEDMNDLRKQLGEFQQYTQAAFEALNTQVAQLTARMAQENYELELQIGSLGEKISALQESLSKEQATVFALQNELQNLFAESVKAELHTTIEDSVGWLKRTDENLSPAKLQEALVALKKYATEVASGAIANPKTQPYNFEGAGRQLTSEPSGELREPGEAILYLAVFPGEQTPAWTNIAPPTSLVNAIFWAEAARAYAQLMQENASHATEPDIAGLKALENEGLSLENAEAQWSAKSGGKGTKTDNAILDEALAHVKSAESGSGVDETKSVTSQLEAGAEEYLTKTLKESTGVKENPTKVNLWGGPNQAWSGAAVADSEYPVLKWTQCSGSEETYVPLEEIPFAFFEPPPGAPSSIPAVVANGVRLGVIGAEGSKDPVELSVCRRLSHGRALLEEKATVKFNNAQKNTVMGGIGECDGSPVICSGGSPAEPHGFAFYDALLCCEANVIEEVKPELERAVLEREAELEKGAYEEQLAEIKKEPAPAANLGGARALVQSYVRVGLPQALDSNAGLQEDIEGTGAQFVDPEVSAPRSVPEQLKLLVTRRAKRLEAAIGYALANEALEAAEEEYKSTKQKYEEEKGQPLEYLYQERYEHARKRREAAKTTFEALPKEPANELETVVKADVVTEVKERTNTWASQIAEEAKPYIEDEGKNSLPEGGGEAVSQQSPLVESTINRLRLIRFVLKEAKAPSAETIAPTGITSTGATVKGEVELNGGESEACDFEYGTTESYGHIVKCETIPQVSEKMALVSAKVTNWTKGGSFHYRVVIKTWGGTAYGQDVKVQLQQSGGGPAAPSVVTTGVTGLGAHSTTVEGTVNPNGEAVTVCEFTVERLSGGLPTGETKKVPCASAPGSGTEAVGVKALVTGLLPGTTYRFSLTASNVAGMATSEPPSEFTTLTSAFEVIKKQRFAGEKAYTTENLVGTAPETVEYEIIVKNTGGTTVKVGEVIDANAPACEGAPQDEAVAPGEEAVEATCSVAYKTSGGFRNVAMVITSESKGESNEVTVELKNHEVEEELAFEVVKEQRFAGEKAYTTAKLVGKAPATIEYEIIVKNTGKTRLEVEQIEDPKAAGCGGTAKRRELAPGEEAVETTCSLEYKTSGVFKNVAFALASDNERASNEVEVDLEPVTAFQVIKEQRFAGEKAYTTAKLVGKAPETVEYEIVVKNTGETAVEVGEILDTNAPGCKGVAKVHKLAPGEEAVEATCSVEHKSTGVFKNVAVVFTSAGKGESNEVETDLEGVTNFQVIKQQRFKGAGSFTKEKLSGKAPATIEYEILVKNIGETTLEVQKVIDANAPGCEKPEKPELKPGEEAVEAICSVEHGSPGVFKNRARVLASGIEEISNEVEAELSEPANESFQIVKEQRLAGQPAYTTGKLAAHVGETVEYRIVVTNTGNVTEKYAAFSDHNCTNIAGGKSELKPAESATWTCEHVLTASGVYVNEASIEKIGPPGKDQASNKVEVEVKEPTTAFAVTKAQRFKGAGSYTTSKLAGTAPATVEYEILVKNTGETTLEIEKLLDANAPGCQTAPAKPKLAPGEEAVEATCAVEYKTAGVFKNGAFVEAGGKEESSNEVEVQVSEPTIETFEISKEQKLAGQPTYTKSKLAASVGETVDYKIVVTNTGNVTETFGALSDSNCTKIAGGASHVKPGESATWTCEHTLVASGVYVNEASIEETVSEQRAGSNKVEVEVKEHAKEELVVEKEQRIGSGSLTKKKLTGTVGEVVDYQITVRNTGEATITLAKIIDPNCTNMSGPGKAQLAPGQSTSYSCEHVLGGSGTFTNVAEVETGGGAKAKSNAVEVKVREGQVCSVESLPSFVDQGELEEASSVADVIHIGCLPSLAEQKVQVSDAELFNECAHSLSWAAAYAPALRVEGPSFEVELDDDGNATVVLWGGPSCAAGSTVITAALLAPPYTTVSSEFAVLAPKATEPGVKALPAKEVEDATYSAVATIIEVEYPVVDGGQYVRVGAPQLAASCLLAPHLVWIGPDERPFGGLEELAEEVEEPTSEVLKLDNDGNAFVVVFGGGSCAAGRSEIEATLMTPPYTTHVTDFTIQPPHTTIKAKK